jgi:RNA ligase
MPQTLGLASALHVSDLLDPAGMDAAIAEGFVRAQYDGPARELAILNYTEQAVYTRTWTPVTRQCRGLIVHQPTGMVVARPWPKFFNYGERASDTLDLTAPVEVTDKADGSLGILYVAVDGHPAIATRGSFTSEQAQHATALYRDRYEGKWGPHGGVTYLFEIVYPANRIVLDYGDMDDLILLGAVDIATGETFGPDLGRDSGWPGPVARTFDYATLADAIAAEPRPNAEGLVVRYLAGEHAGTMLKLKQDDYVALHRIITGLTARRIWERLAVWDVLHYHPETTPRELGQRLRMDPADVRGIVEAGPDWRDQITKTAPEEFTDWINATISGLEVQVAAILADVEDIIDKVSGQDRKMIAQQIAAHPYRGLIFGALDKKPISAQAWALIRPEAERPFRAVSEDVA